MIAEERYVGEDRYTYLDMTADLKDAQTATAVTWSIESGSGITLDVGTNAITTNSQGVAAVAIGKFNYTAAVPSNDELYTLAASVTCANPTETKIGYVQVKVSDVP